MSKPTKQEQKDEAWKAYEAIKEPAYEAYKARVNEIDALPDDPDVIIVDGKEYKLIGSSDD